MVALLQVTYHLQTLFHPKDPKNRCAKACRHSSLQFLNLGIVLVRILCKHYRASRSFQKELSNQLTKQLLSHDGLGTSIGCQTPKSGSDMEWKGRDIYPALQIMERGGCYRLFRSRSCLKVRASLKVYPSGLSSPGTRLRSEKTQLRSSTKKLIKHVVTDDCHNAYLGPAEKGMKAYGDMSFAFSFVNRNGSKIYIII